MDDDRRIIPPQHEQADAAGCVGDHGAHDTEPDVAAGIPAIKNVSYQDARDAIMRMEHPFGSPYDARHRANDQRALTKPAKSRKR